MFLVGNMSLNLLTFLTHKRKLFGKKLNSNFQQQPPSVGGTKNENKKYIAQRNKVAKDELSHT